MPWPLTVGAAVGGAGLIGGLLDKGLEWNFRHSKELDDLLAAGMKGGFEGWMPNESVFRQQADATAAAVQDQLPMAMENFNAELAKRGTYRSGESTPRMYQDVIAPIARQIADVRYQSELKFHQMKGEMAYRREALKQQYAQLLLQRYMAEFKAKAKQPTPWGAFGTLSGSLIGTEL